MNYEYQELLPFARNTQDENCLMTLSEGHTQAEAAQIMGVTKRTIERRMKCIRDNAALRGWSPEHDMVHTVPEGYFVKGTSTLYDETGTKRLQWVKSNKTYDEVVEALMAFVEGMKGDIQKAPASDFLGVNPNTDIIPWFNIGDAHLGALSYKMETGEDNDIRITERELLSAMFTLIDETQSCERCVIYDCGDMTHHETFDGITMGHGHRLDCDSRYPKMIESYSRIMRALIHRALEKFEFVDVIINQGNHSRSNDIFMRELLCCYFEDESRVHVLDNSNVFIPYRMGNTFVMCHHGDKTKHQKLSGVMTNDYAKDWGESTYRYIWTGHIHHREMLAKEEAGVVIESWNTLSRGDKYAHDNGWRSRKCLSVVELSKTYGEVGRKTIPIERVQDIINRRLPGSSASSNKDRGVYTVS